jgi:hypothetical protein
MRVFLPLPEEPPASEEPSPSPLSESSSFAVVHDLEDFNLSFADRRIILNVGSGAESAGISSASLRAGLKETEYSQYIWAEG